MGLFDMFKKKDSFYAYQKIIKSNGAEGLE